MLKAGLASSPNKHMKAFTEASLAAKAGISEAAWQTLGLEKLNLNWEVLFKFYQKKHEKQLIPQGLAQLFLSGEGHLRSSGGMLIQ